MHFPVLLNEALEYLALRPDGIYVDATAGLGGHTGAIAQRLTTGIVIACDRDLDSLELARRNTSEWASRIRYVHTPFSGIPEALKREGITQVNGLLADLGVSRYQLTDPERGFSLMSEGPVDMRMDRSQQQTAADIVNFSAERDLADLIYQLGEERRSRNIARAIVRARPIRSTLHLAQTIEKAAPRTGRLHPATQTFMALRLAVNNELGELEALLQAAPNLVAGGGRIVIITFMSLEDRKVKQAFQDLQRANKISVLTKHVVKPKDQEVNENAPSRSAKLRAAEVQAQ